MLLLERELRTGVQKKLGRSLLRYAEEGLDAGRTRCVCRRRGERKAEHLCHRGLAGGEKSRRLISYGLDDMNVEPVSAG